MWAAVSKVRQELVPPMVDDLIGGSLVEASVGADGSIIIDADLLEELRPLLWKQAGPRATADATAWHEHDSTVTAPPMTRQHMQALLADLLPPLTMALCDTSDYPLVAAAYRDYHAELSARIQAGEDVSRLGVRRYVLEKLRLGQAAGIRESMLASVDPKDEGQAALWRYAFDAAERHIKALRGSELAVFCLEDFIAVQLTARPVSQTSASSLTTTASSSTTTTTSSSPDEGR